MSIIIKIEPKDINTEEHFWNAFNHSETEASAKWIVKLCQQFREWKPFTLDDIEKLYSQKYKHGFRFNNLVTGGWIKFSRGIYTVTDQCVERCYVSSPVEKQRRR